MRIGIVGHFGLGKTLRNGQTIKTVTLADSLEKYSDAEVIRVDTHGWTRNPLKLLLGVCGAFRDCDGVIMLPAHNGVKVFAPLLAGMKRLYQKKVFYDVVGGWLPEMVQKNGALKKQLKDFDDIWVETSTMKCTLEAQGLSNVTVIPNFKDLQPLQEPELVYNQGRPLKLCTFSRVMKEKGIETLANTVRRINEGRKALMVTLDIYGQVESRQEEWFDALQAYFPAYITYRGCAAPEESIHILKGYHALVFPTHFYTEGIPGTIIDAYAAGVPVVCARWESCGDIVADGKTGLIYPFDDTKALENLLLETVKDPGRLQGMKKNCLWAAREYSAPKVVEQIIQLVTE